MSDPQSVTFNVTLDTRIGTRTDYDADGGGSQYDVTIGDRVAEIIAERLVEDARRTIGEHLNYHNVVTEAQAAAREAVAERFRTLLDEGIVRTDGFGNQRGEPTTLAEIVTSEAQAWLGASHKSSGYGQSKTNLQVVVSEAVGSQFQAEIRKQVKIAQDAVLAAVSAKAAEVYAEIIRRAAS